MAGMGVNGLKPNLYPRVEGYGGEVKVDFDWCIIFKKLIMSDSASN